MMKHKVGQFSSGYFCLQEQKTFLRGNSKIYHSEKRSNIKFQTAELYYGGNLKPDTNENCQWLLLHILNIKLLKQICTVMIKANTQGLMILASAICIPSGPVCSYIKP